MDVAVGNVRLNVPVVTSRKPPTSCAAVIVATAAKVDLVHALIGFDLMNV
jgi:hypothetical protein